MAKKKIQKTLDEMTREELIERCKNQKSTIKGLQKCIEETSALKQKIMILELAFADMKVDHKVRICIQESLSLMNDIEKLKNKIRDLGGDE